MTEHDDRRHGLERFLASLPRHADGTVEIEVLPPLGQINLRGDPGSVSSVASQLLGEELPLTANTMRIGVRRVYWLGPDEWLIVTVAEETAGLLAQLRDALQQASLTDVSGGQVALRISGPNARDVLEMGCTLDFHPSEFKVGDCAQTGLAKATVLIGLIDNEPTYEILVRRSFADYLARWLRRSAGEYWQVS